MSTAEQFQIFIFISATDCNRQNSIFTSKSRKTIKHKMRQGLQYSF